MAGNKFRAKDEGYFRIGELAKRAGVSPRTLRFYEEQGLLSPSSRYESGMRLYGVEDVDRVHTIRELQETLGCSLAEIKEMISVEGTDVDVALADNGDSSIDHQSRLRRAVEITRSQLQLISQKADRLEQLRRQLEQRMVQYVDRQPVIVAHFADQEALIRNGS